MTSLQIFAFYRQNSVKKADNRIITVPHERIVNTVRYSLTSQKYQCKNVLFVRTPRLREKKRTVVACNCALGIFYVEEFSEKLLNIRRGLQKTKPTERQSQSYFFLKSNILEIKFRHGATSRAVGCAKHAYARAHVRALHMHTRANARRARIAVTHAAGTFGPRRFKAVAS